MDQRIGHGELHRVVVTCIVYNQNHRILITQRQLNADIFPGKWGFPGGGLKRDDYVTKPMTLSDGWHNPLEIALRREVLEEVGIEVGSLEYVNNFSHIHKELAILGFRFAAPYKSGAVKLNHELIDHRWVTAQEAESYACMGGVIDVLKQVSRMLMYKGVLGATP